MFHFRFTRSLFEYGRSYVQWVGFLVAWSSEPQIAIYDRGQIGSADITDLLHFTLTSNSSLTFYTLTVRKTALLHSWILYRELLARLHYLAAQPNECSQGLNECTWFKKLPIPLYQPSAARNLCQNYRVPKKRYTHQVATRLCILLLFLTPRLSIFFH